MNMASRVGPVAGTRVLDIGGVGNELVGGGAGVPMTWYEDMKRVFVCQGGQTPQIGFPAGVVSAVSAVEASARLGRCEHPKG
jgi:hypothetical protein